MKAKRSEVINSLKGLQSGRLSLSEVKEKLHDPQDVPWLYLKEAETGKFREFDGTVHTPQKIRELALSKKLVIRFQTSDTLGAIPEANTAIKIIKEEKNGI